MSPEQAAGESIDHRSDLFSLGSVLYACCTGRPPFRAGGAHAVMRRVIDDTPRPIQEVNPEIPGWLCDLIARLHAKDPAARFQSAREVADLLGGRLAQLQQPGQAAPPRAAEKPAAAGPARKRRWAVPVAASLVLLCLGGGLFVAYRAGWLSRPPEPSRTEQPGPGPSPEKNGGDAEAPPAGEEKPVAKEVLEELRRLEAIQQRNVEVAQQNYEAERVTRSEVCQAEDLLIETRIKLATAEHKPVVGLLENLVRNREEELRVMETRFEFGAAAEADVLPARQRLSEARARLASARAESPAAKP
jgi:hypothetical protein